MSERKGKQKKVFLVWGIVLLLGTGMACQLTSPRPASWAGTPTAEARSTEIALTQAAISGAGAFVFTPTVPSSTPASTPTPTATPTPQDAVNGPWLVFPAPNGQGLHAYDTSTQDILMIDLPGPIIASDLTRGMAPDGSYLVLRAGSALNTDELALYRVDLPSFEVSKLTPLLSITAQRKIVNDEGTRVLETLLTVTRPDGLAWSPDARFLAFSAALNNETSDLYVLDMLNDRIDRLNGLFSQNASPVWSPGGDWLISQELEYVHRLEAWRSELVTGLRVPSFDSQNTIYLPPITSLEEAFVGWLNPATFISYSVTESGPQVLRQVNVEELEDLLIFDGSFQQVAYDPGSGVITFSINFAAAISQGLAGGIYRLIPDSPVQNLQAAGDWPQLAWDPGGMFVASGTQGVLLFTPQGESMLLPDQGNARLSPNGNWLIAWGDGEGSAAGAQLFQADSSNPLQTLLEQPVESLIWQPDSKGFLILSEGSLFHFVFPSLRPDEIITGLPADTGFGWVWVD